MRTTDEILEWMKDDDLFSTRVSDTIYYLPYELARARPLLTPEAQAKYDAAPETWPKVELTREHVLWRMRDYFAFACEKASNHRGLSAGRSILHYQNWVWLLGDSPLVDNYSSYGAPILKEVATRYDFPWPNDPGLTRMAEGCD